MVEEQAREGASVRRGRGGRGRRTGWLGRLVFLLVVALSSSCASPGVDVSDGFEAVPMNRVVPYPLPEELEERVAVIRIVDRPAPGFDPAALAAPRDRAWTAVAEIAQSVGASLVTEEDGESGRWGAAAADPHYAVGLRFFRHRFDSIWKPPLRLPWQTEADLAGKRGTCRHTAAIGLEVDLESLHAPEGVERLFSLSHSTEQTTKDLDPSCTLAPVTRDLLIERAVEEALACLEIPLGAALAPRGHLVAHERAIDGGRNLYRATIGANQGMTRGRKVEIRRQQRATTPSGAILRSEQVLAVGEVSDRIEPDAAWIVVDPSRAQDQLLDGDLVRPVFSKGLLSSLTGPDCDAILLVR